MKYLLALLLGFGAISATACKSSTQAADVKAETVTLALSGMT